VRVRERVGAAHDGAFSLVALPLCFVTPTLPLPLPAGAAVVRQLAKPGFLECQEDRGPSTGGVLRALFATRALTAFIPSLMHPSTHTLTHSLTRPLTLTHTRSRTDPITHPPTHAALTHSLTHSRTHALTPLLTHSLTHPPTLSLTHSLTHSPTLTHSLTHPFTHPPTHPRRWTSSARSAAWVSSATHRQCTHRCCGGYSSCAGAFAETSATGRRVIGFCARCVRHSHIRHCCCCCCCDH
jgi:hypothetical protein